mgnify:CR=1 FL=1
MREGTVCENTLWQVCVGLAAECTVRVRLPHVLFWAQGARWGRMRLAERLTASLAWQEISWCNVGK